MRIYIILLFVLYSFYTEAQVKQFTDVCYKDIKAKEFKGLIDNNTVVIIDVRVLKEYEKKRIENALLASDSGILEAICKELEKSDTILVYCDKGDRSAKVANILCSKYKFVNVYNLKDGLISWEKEALPMDKSKINYE